MTGEANQRDAGPVAARTDAATPDAAPEPASDEAARGDAMGGQAATPDEATAPARSRGPARREFITYPTSRLLAVADTSAVAAAAVEALARAPVPFPDVAVITGPDATEQLRQLGPTKGALSRLVRLVQFTTMDQMPDFRVYEAALRDGRAIVAVRIGDTGTIPVARDVLVGAGLHFLNFYGRWSTAEVTPWRGAELDLPAYLRR